MADVVESMRRTVASDAVEVKVSGKLTEVRHHGSTFFSTVLAPAKDAFSQPMPFEVRSARPVGREGEMVEVRCELSGYFGRTYDTTDKHTGEVRRVKPIGLALDVIQ